MTRKRQPHCLAPMLGFQPEAQTRTAFYHAMTSKVKKQNCIVLTMWIELVCVAFA